jgi:hypothetical protein
VKLVVNDGTLCRPTERQMRVTVRWVERSRDAAARAGA